MILITEKTKDYELLDSGNGAKLERYGDIVFNRPDPEALWKPFLDKDEWLKADAIFKRNDNKSSWKLNKNVPEKWNISFGDLNFYIKPTSFKHTGLFPEQLSNWIWMADKISKSKNKQIKVLNLFGYTGGASLACAKVGAEVVHVDGSKMAVIWARENAQISNLENAPIRWIVDDVISFLKREVKRGNKYDGIVMDPPVFGHGPKKELWKIEENFLELMDLCKLVLSTDPLFVLINGYTAGYSPIVYENNLKDLMEKYEGQIEIGELTIRESSRDRLLPCSIFARWSK